MIHSSVSSSEAEAIQRQVDQLFGILQQMLHDTMLWLASRNHQKPQEEVLRIWMGNGKDGRILRQVYGPIANGKNRNDLTPERLRAILDALQEPVTKGINLAQYAKRKPAIEIKIDDVTLFRQERDGVVTVNQIQLQQQVQNGHSSKQLSQSPTQADSSKSEQDLQDEQIHKIAQTARHLMNPLSESGQPFLTKAGFGKFTLEYDREHDSLVISRGQDVILRDCAGQIENIGVTSADWKTFQSIGERIAQTPVLTTATQKQETAIKDQRVSQTPTPVATALSSTSKVADRQINQLQNPRLQQFLQRIVQGTANWLNQALLNWQHKTIAHLAMKAFQQGYDRTGEETYLIGAFSISREPRNQFTLRDQTGIVMRFGGDLGNIKLADLSDRLSQSSINDAVVQLSSLPPQGQHEATYAFRVREAEQIVRDFLAYMKTPIWDYEQGKFRLETIDNQVLITSKQDGRGQIHGPAKVMQKNHREKLIPQPTRLTWKDLDHLDSIRDKLQARIAADREKQKESQSAHPVSLNGKVHQVSQRSHWKPKGRQLE